jgi:predicted transcriptional regulator
MVLVAVRPEVPENRSNAVILSIDSKWLDSLQFGSLRWIIRKRLPFATKLKLVYFHAKSPVSGIIGRAKILFIERVSSSYLLRNANKLEISAKEILAYLGDAPEVGLMQFEKMETAKDTVGLHKLRERLDYFPPQSFAFISRSALPMIDEMSGF